MSTEIAVIASTVDPALAAIEAELAALEASEGAGVVEEVVRDIAGDDARAEIYAEQPSEVGTVEPEAVAAAAEKPAKAAKAPKAPKEPKTPGVARTRGNVADLDAGVFSLETADVSGDHAANKVAVLALRPTAKKIAEKFDGLFLNLAAGKAPSTYVGDCFKALDAAGTMSGPEMVKALEAHDYTIGTARSQAQQVISLFQTLKVATKSEGKLTVNPNSIIAQTLRTLCA